MDYVILKNAIQDILKNVPYRPFFCLPMSAILYAILKDNHGIDTRLVTGDLQYKGQNIFKQDFSITDVKSGSLQDWSGHAWVEIDDQICDLSFFRTLYSEKFTRPYKAELIQFFGEGRGCLLGNPEQMHEYGFSYLPVEYLDDGVATAIIKGYESILLNPFT